MHVIPTETPRLRAEIEGPIASVLIDNPARRNALDLAMWTAIPPLLRRLEAEPGVRAVILRGAGELAFASGADISEFGTVRATAEGGKAYEAANEEAFRSVSQCSLPVIAMIRGFCLGGGLGLALSCDLRVAAGGSVFGIPAAKLGVGYPPSAMAYVVAAAGPMAAKDLFFTGRRIDAQEAFRLGLVARVLAADQLESETLGLARAIAENAPLTIRAAKRAIDAVAGLPGSASFDELAGLAEACFDSEDYREGRSAFLEKRKPAFQGR